MAKRICSALLALMLCIGFLSACGGGKGQSGVDSLPEADSGGDLAEATVMVYLVGSDLETNNGAASADLLEMVNSGYDFEHKNLLVMTGGAKAWNKSTGISSQHSGAWSPPLC